MLKKANPEFILNLASELKEKCRYRVFAYELIRSHKEAFQSIGEKELEEFGRGINSWWSVDAFARTLAGPAWLRGQVTDGLIHNNLIIKPHPFNKPVHELAYLNT